MKQLVFQETREATWVRYENIVNELKRGRLLPKQFSSDEFLSLYKQLNRDLSIAKTRGYSQMLVNRLNRLVSLGHKVLPGYHFFSPSVVWRFLSEDFPVAVRDAKAPILVALAFFCLPLFMIVAMLSFDANVIYELVPASTLRLFEQMYDPAAERWGSGRSSDSEFVMFGYYIQNNIGIAVSTFALGVAAGLWPLLVLFLNGLLIGIVAFYITHIGYGEFFWSFVVTHGALETPALIIAAGSGLILGYAVVAPGRKSRRQALLDESRKAFTLIFGAITMLLLAAFIEAFWSSSPAVDAGIKYAVGGLLWILVFLYFVTVGRRES